MFEDFLKVKKIKILLKSDKNNRYFHENLYNFVIISLFFLEWEMFWKEVLEKMKAHILCSKNFVQKLCSLWDNVEKHGVGRQATDHHITGQGGTGVPDN